MRHLERRVDRGGVSARARKAGAQAFGGWRGMVRRLLKEFALEEVVMRVVQCVMRDALAR